jgi:hypothetical protein
MNRIPSEHGEKWITLSCRAELEIGVGDEDVTERSEHPGEQVVQSARESAAQNAQQLNLKIGIYLIMSYSILDPCLCISPLTIVSNFPLTHAGLHPTL